MGCNVILMSSVRSILYRRRLYYHSAADPGPLEDVPSLHATELSWPRTDGTITIQLQLIDLVGGICCRSHCDGGCWLVVWLESWFIPRQLQPKSGTNMNYVRNTAAVWLCRPSFVSLSRSYGVLEALFLVVSTGSPLRFRRS